MITYKALDDQQTELLILQQRMIRDYRAQLACVRAETEAELARIEQEGGTTGFAERIYRLTEQGR